MNEAAETDAKPRCDNYERYLRDEYGYAYNARDVVELQELERHDRCRSAPREVFGEQELAELGDFSLLGLARGMCELDEIEPFVEIVERLVASEDSHPAVVYHEIPLLAGLVLAEDGRHETAIALLDRGIERWPDARLPALQQKALVLLDAEGADSATELWERIAEQWPDDAELRFEIAEDLWRAERPRLARRWLNEARSTAERVGDDPLLVDIDVLEERLERVTGE